MLGTFLCGDINAHHSGWLRWSHSITPEGKSLFEHCSALNLKECTRKATRGKYLLDLTLTDIDECVTCKAVPGVSDHMMVMCNIALPFISDHPVQRGCFIYSKANWKGLNSYLLEFDWKALFQDLKADEIVTIFTSTVLDIAKKFIPFEWKSIQKSKHPWLNDECKKLVSDKNNAFGTPSFEEKRDNCSNGFFEEYQRYVTHTKDILHGF